MDTTSDARSPAGAVKRGANSTCVSVCFPAWKLDVHLIADNYGTHKHARVKAWLARRLRFHLHHTLTYASWLNQGRGDSRGL